MDGTIFSILMFVLGLIVGAGVLIFINYLKIKNSGNKAELIIEKAKKDSKSENSFKETEKKRQKAKMLDISKGAKKKQFSINSIKNKTKDTS